MGEKNKLTEILAAVNLYYEKHGFSETIRELKDIKGIKWNSTACCKSGALDKRN